MDPITGVHSDFVLPEDLRSYLLDYGISTLSDAHLWGCGSYSHQYWLTADHLELDGEWKKAWTVYIEGLTHVGIRLRQEPNSLAWLYNKKTGHITS